MKDWIRCACIRALRTAAQTAIAALPTTAFLVGEIDWVAVFSMAAGGFVLSMLTSLAGIPEANDGRSPLMGGDGDEL